MTLPERTIVRVAKPGKDQAYWKGYVLDQAEDKRGNVYFNILSEETRGVRAVMPNRLQVECVGPQGGLTWTTYEDLTGDENLHIIPPKDDA